MAKNVKNKYPADKTGTKYSEFRNTKRTAPGKTKAEKEAVAKQASNSGTEQSAAKTA